MISIERLTPASSTLPTIRPHKLAMHTLQRQTLVLLRLTCSDGSQGLGEATTIGGLAYAGESPESIKTILDTYLAPLVIGQERRQPQCRDAARRAQRARQYLRQVALETALLDARASVAAWALAELLGGRVQQGWRWPGPWPAATTAKDVAEAERMLELRRHRHFKLKIGAAEPARDIAHVQPSSAPWAIAPACGSTSTRAGAKAWPCAPARPWPTPGCS